MASLGLMGTKLNKIKKMRYLYFNIFIFNITYLIFSMFYEYNKVLLLNFQVRAILAYCFIYTK